MNAKAQALRPEISGTVAPGTARILNVLDAGGTYGWKSKENPFSNNLVEAGRAASSSFRARNPGFSATVERPARSIALQRCLRGRQVTKAHRGPGVASDFFAYAAGFSLHGMSSLSRLIF